MLAPSKGLEFFFRKGMSRENFTKVKYNLLEVQVGSK